MQTILFCCTGPSLIAMTQPILQRDVDHISDWITSQDFSINPTKSSLQEPCQTPSQSIALSSAPGCHHHLRWNVHISNTCKSRTLPQLQSSRPASQLYKALVLPKLDYCSSVWDPASSTLSDKLESVQRFAAKLCWSASPTELTSALNWPSLRSRRSRPKSPAMQANH